MNKIVTTPEQEPLFAAADAGVPLLMERNGRRYYVVAEDQLDAFVSFIAPRITRQMHARPAPALGDAVRALKAG